MSYHERLAYRIPEAAKKIGISTATLYRLIAARKLKTVKIGRSRVIAESELRALVDHGTS